MGVGNVESGRAGERDMRVRNVGFDQLPGVAVVQGDSDLLGFEIVSTGGLCGSGRIASKKRSMSFFEGKFSGGGGDVAPPPPDPRLPRETGRKLKELQVCPSKTVSLKGCSRYFWEQFVSLSVLWRIDHKILRLGARRFVRQYINGQFHREVWRT